MRKGLRLGVLGLWLLSAPLWASSWYDDDLLRYWQGRYAANLQWNFDNLVIGSLTRSERHQLGAVRLDTPLRAAGELAQDPLLFYAHNGRVVMPVQSVKFFDDLSLAWAYAWANQLPLDNVTDYMAMLKYRQAPPEGWPAPLVALGVPEQAWKQDPRVDDVSQKILKSALVWIMAHEVAHLLYRHPGYGPGVSPAEAQANEAAADQFANEIMRRIGVAPGGMANFFMLLAHWSPSRGDFDSDEAWQRFLAERATHPLTAARIRAIAADLMADPEAFSVEEADRERGAANVRFIGQQLNQIADILGDTGVQRAIAARAKAPARLSYQPGNRPVAADGDFGGLFRGQFIHYLPGGEQESLALTVELQQRGKLVRGRFDFGLGSGEIEGRVIDRELVFQWVWAEAYGQGRLVASDAGLTGLLGYEERDRGAGEWHLQR
ncbi:phage exclusion protein Lit family protein [Motiliproteus sediminis]|uniref:phage exclusion protein Lit family protein n=1 Tax=Motiliproteus sediminis TaxID=1468178 RepID=UPI001AEFBA09|nr:phage exclusion protein Lit family protein [Motiliproteus sediminis]